MFASNFVHGLKLLWNRRRPRYLVPIRWKLLLLIGLLGTFAAMALLDSLVIYPEVDRKSDLFHVATYWTHYGKSGTYLFPSAIALFGMGFIDWRRCTRAACVFGNRCALALSFMLLSVSTSALVNALLKQVFGRARPREYDNVGIFFFDPFTLSANFASFPSGHATAAGAASACIALLFPSFRVPVLILGALLAATRAIVGSHYPADVVAGYLLGAWSSYAIAVILARRGLLFKASGGLPTVKPGLRILARRVPWTRSALGGKTIAPASVAHS